MKKKRLIIIGAGGHGRVVYDIAENCGYSEIFFLDDSVPLSESVIGKSSDYVKYIDSSVFFVAIANSKIRKKLYEELCANRAQIVTLIHPSAVIAKSVKIELGTVIMPGAVINVDTIIGAGGIINTCASVDHDCVIRSFSHVSVGAHLCGTVEIGNNVWIGAGATVVNNITICDNCTIGAGAVVTKNIDVAGIYKGVPARLT